MYFKLDQAKQINAKRDGKPWTVCDGYQIDDKGEMQPISLVIEGHQQYRPGNYHILGRAYLTKDRRQGLAVASLVPVAAAASKAA